MTETLHNSQINALLSAFERTRKLSLRLAAPLSEADVAAQSMPDASPTKWHLAHTTWFFEEFVLAPHVAGYKRFDPHFGFLFNSYYDAVGERHPRPQRGLLTRPSLSDVLAYRAHVDERLAKALKQGAFSESVGETIRLGVHHEQQHQELLLTDILHLFAQNPIGPAYAPPARVTQTEAAPLRWRACDGGVVTIGAPAQGFAFDSERPRHDVLLQPYKLAERCVTNGEWRAFIEDGGYETPSLWMADGWARAQEESWRAPLYWRRDDDGGWSQFGLRGRQAINWAAPVSHISWYEADAFARWAGARLPNEAEWENAAAETVQGKLLDLNVLQPSPAEGEGLAQMYGDVWEWTATAFAPYPGFAPAPGAVGEYNGKFMTNQYVLRGGSCVTPEGHMRRSYRNFFYPHQRWQFSGLRLAADA